MVEQNRIGNAGKRSRKKGGINIAATTAEA